MTKLYFAYGSNLNLKQMRKRCPRALPLETAKLAGHRLVFRLVADVEQRNGCTVYGALFQITPACERALDRYEGYPWAYGKKLIRVKLPNGKRVRAMTYVQHATGYEPPSASYYETIREGFDDWDLPLSRLISALLHADAEDTGRQRFYSRPAPRLVKPARRQPQATFLPESAPVVPIEHGYHDQYASRRYEKWLRARREYEQARGK